MEAERGEHMSQYNLPHPEDGSAQNEKDIPNILTNSRHSYPDNPLFSEQMLEKVAESLHHQDNIPRHASEPHLQTESM